MTGLDGDLRAVHKYFDKKSHRQVKKKKDRKRLIHLKGTINPTAVKYLGKWACFI